MKLKLAQCEYGFVCVAVKTAVSYHYHATEIANWAIPGQIVQASSPPPLRFSPNFAHTLTYQRKKFGPNFRSQGQPGHELEVIKISRSTQTLKYI